MATKNTKISMPMIPVALLERLRATATGAGQEQHLGPYIAPVVALRPVDSTGTQYELLIYGDIGESWWGDSVLAADIVKQLNELPPTVAQINVRINSYGGSCSDGFAIFNALNRMGATKTVTVDGVAMSIASLIAMCGDTIEMPETSLLMIHAPLGGCMGNSIDMRDFADFLDQYAEAMAPAYVAKSGQTRDAILALLKDGKDHTYTAAQAKDLGFCDVLIPLVEPDEEDPETEQAAAAFLAGMGRFVAQSPQMLGAMNTAVRHSLLFASGPSAAATQPAPGASTGGFDMLRKINGRTVSLAPREKAKDPADGGGGGGGGGGAQPTQADITARALADLKTRNDAITVALKPMLNVKAIAELQTQALTDPTMTIDQVNAKALAIMAAHATPNGNDPGRIEAGADQREKTRAAAVNFLLVRAGGDAVKGMKPEEIAAGRQGNPFNGMTLLEIARACCVAAGVNASGMSKSQIVASAITHSESDFPNIFENLLHKTLINSFNGVEATWRAFCKTGTLSDFRPHNRYGFGGFSDLLPVDETGEYQDGTFSDAEKESITGKSKGRILNLSREMIINDDMGVFVSVAQKLGQAAGRTLEKDVYALLALNGGAGPAMNDGFHLFDAAHHLNVAATPAIVGTDSFDDVRVGLGSQMDPSGNDFLSLQPAIWLGPLKYKGDADVVNGSKYNVDVSSKFEIPNKAYGMFRQTVGTPRLGGTAWYAFADPNVEAVIEAAFLDGVQEPQIASETSFRSNGVSWRVLYDYAVGAVGWRGARRNAGA